MIWGYPYFGKLPYIKWWFMALFYPQERPWETNRNCTGLSIITLSARPWPKVSKTLPFATKNKVQWCSLIIKLWLTLDGIPHKNLFLSRFHYLLIKALHSLVQYRPSSLGLPQGSTPASVSIFLAASVVLFPRTLERWKSWAAEWDTLFAHLVSFHGQAYQRFKRLGIGVVPPSRPYGLQTRRRPAIWSPRLLMEPCERDWKRGNIEMTCWPVENHCARAVDLPLSHRKLSDSGKNPWCHDGWSQISAPVDRWSIPSFKGFQPSKVVQDFATIHGILICLVYLVMLNPASVLGFLSIYLDLQPTQQLK